MPSLPAVPNVAKVVFQWSDGADFNAQNVMHFHYTGSPTSANLITAVTAMDTFIAANIAPYIGTHLHYLSTTITDLSTMAQPHAVAGTSTVGTRAGTAVPSAACALQRGTIPRRYKGGKPRVYLPFGTSSDLTTSNEWSGAALTDFTTGFNVLLNAATAHSAPLNFDHSVNIGYYSGYTLGPAQPGGFRKKVPTPLGAPNVDTITVWTSIPRVASQRRRNK